MTTALRFVALSSLSLGLSVLGCSAGGVDETPPGERPTKPSDSDDTGDGDGDGDGDGSGGGASGGNAGGAGGGAGGGPDDSDFFDEDNPIIIGEDPTAPLGCGNGVLTSDEACDDGNEVSGDGCDEQCLRVEPGFSCAAPGQPCREIARCGDGLVAASEQCDDGNTEVGDGCSERCKVELGKKCEGEPSVCTDAECGNGIVEGAESCDDGNTVPFDGCSALCLREPNCEGTSCTSECGDGLIINEDCDDGNNIDGDGCSSTCELENGFTCTQEATCEEINGECVLRVPVIYRDFPESHPDFGFDVYECGIDEGDPIVPGIAAAELDAEGRPVLDRPTATACIDSPDSFAQWFRDDGGSVKVTGDLVLWDNGDGGYVNRFGENGERFVVTQAREEGSEQTINGTNCETGCAERVRSSLQCDNVCRPANDAVDQAERQLQQLEDQSAQPLNELEELRDQLQPLLDEVADLEAQIAELEAEETVDEDAIADLELEIEALQPEITPLENQIAAREEAAAEILDDMAAQEARIATLEEAAEECNTECATDFDGRVSACVDDCKPCSFSGAQLCTGGEYVSYDGTPLFFPVDSVTGPTQDLGPAGVPAQYGFVGWPEEDTVFPGAPDHNFYFTTEVQYWFRYEQDTNATLDFTGDDDVWVYINGKLAVDLGGIHVPMDGSVTINAETAGDFDLEPGNVYKINVFQAERKMTGSSFRLTLSGFEATPSDCSAVCGDGILSFGEECDDGENDGGYGECDEGCVLGPFCGDGIVQGNEHCDNGPGGGPGCPGCRKIIAR